VEANAMKRYAIPVVLISAVFALAWAAFGQDAETRTQKLQREAAERAKRYASMSEEEKAAFREQVRQKERMRREYEEKAVKTIEEQVVRLKTAAQFEMPQSRDRDLFKEEISKLSSAFAERRAALQEIVTQVGRLQDRSQQAGEDTQFMIISTDDLKPIQEAAAKEKAGQTRMLIEVLIRSRTRQDPDSGRAGSAQKPRSRGSQLDGDSPGSDPR
jgi:non-ribosomal peptide synthetase component E (peptide arylation enzyme)